MVKLAKNENKFKNIKKDTHMSAYEDGGEKKHQTFSRYKDNIIPFFINDENLLCIDEIEDSISKVEGLDKYNYVVEMSIKLLNQAKHSSEKEIKNYVSTSNII